MVMCCTAASEPRPRNWISPMWLTSKSPTPVRTAMCSAIRPPPAPGYSTGMSQPPKSTILAFRARCVALSAVFFSSAAAGVAGVVMEASRSACGTLFTIGSRRRSGQTRFLARGVGRLRCGRVGECSGPKGPQVLRLGQGPEGPCSLPTLFAKEAKRMGHGAKWEEARR